MDSANGSFSSNVGGRAVGASGGAGGGAIVSSGGGDVVLPVGGEKKSKGPLLAVLALVVIVVCVIVGVVMGRGGGEDPVATNLGESFALYANYLLDGEDSTSDIVGNYSSMKLYAVTTAANGDNLEYFNKLQRLWNDFYGQIEIDDGEGGGESGDKILIPETGRLAGDIEMQNELMDFIVKYVRVGEWNEEKVLSVYVESGAEGVNALIDSQYNDALNTIYEPGREYAKAEADALKAMVRVFDEYNNRGCVSGNSIDETCVNVNSEVLASISEQYVDAERNVNDNVMNESLEYLVENCFAINESLGNKNE